MMPIDEAFVLGLEKKLMEAIRTDDVGHLESVLHDDLLFLAPNGQVVTKRMDLESHERGDMTVERLSADFEEIRILGDTATVTVVYATKGTMLGHPIEGRFRYIRIWKRFEDGWKVLGGACAMLPA
jgi:ketosteroid isomerase-like protein